MRGGVHASEARRRIRFELSHDLKLRAKALEQLGKKEEAAQDLARAKGLTYLSGLTWQRPGRQDLKTMDLPELYVDLLEAEK